MPLYVVLHHPKDRDHWGNQWLDDHCIDSITTTAQIGSLCEEAKRQGAPVWVHRCAYSNVPAVISCSAMVKEVHPLPGKGAFVRFTESTASDGVPPVKPHPGQNFYHSAHYTAAGT